MHGLLWLFSLRRNYITNGGTLQSMSSSQCSGSINYPNPSQVIKKMISKAVGQWSMLADLVMPIAVITAFMVARDASPGPFS